MKIFQIGFFGIFFALLVSCSTGTDRVHQGLRGQHSGASSSRIAPTVAQPPKGVVRNQEASSSGSSGHERADTRGVFDAPEIGRYYQTARKNYDSGNKKEALAQFKTYLKNYPAGQFADEAHFLVAREASAQNDFLTASENYQKILEMNPRSRLVEDSRFLNAVCLYNLGKRRESLVALGELDVAKMSPNQRPTIYPFWGKVAAEEGRWLEATLAFVKARKESSSVVSPKEMEALVNDQIENRLNEAELQFLLNEYPMDFPASEVQMRLVSIKFAAGARAEAKALLQSVVAISATGSPIKQQAEKLLEKVSSDALGPVSARRIGVLVPLSGDRGSAGKAVLDGIKMALEGLQPPVEIVQADTGPTDATAMAAFDRLVFEERVMGVLGPLPGSAADLVAGKSVEYGIPNISFSARPGLTKRGPYVFRVALTPERQVRALVAYAVEKLGAKRFAILFPEDSFGREYANEFFKAVEFYGGSLTTGDSYKPQESDFRALIDNMVGKSNFAYRKSELEDNEKRLKEKLGRELNAREKEATNLLPPIVDFDVLFLPDSFRAVGQIVPALAYADIGNVQIMGPATWNNTKLISRTGQFLENSLFVDFFAADRKSQITRDFVEKHKIKKGSIPSGISALGFDAGLAIRSVFQSESRSPGNREELRSRLERLGSFDGVMGVHTWDSRRDSLSEIQLFQVKKGGFAHLGGIAIKAPSE